MLPRPLPPKPDRRFSRIRLSGQWSLDGLAQALDSRRSEASHQPRSRRRPAHPFRAVHCQVPSPTSARCSGAFGRTALRHYPNPFERGGRSTPTPLSYVPWLHGRYPLPSYYGRSDPGRPFRRRLPWCPDSRHQNFQPFHLQPSAVLHQPRPLPRRWQHYFVRASSLRSQTRQNRRPNRVHGVRLPGRTVLRTGRSLPVALHPGVSPRCSYVQLLALQCQPSQGLSPCRSSALSGARARPVSGRSAWAQRSPSRISP